MIDSAPNEWQTLVLEGRVGEGADGKTEVAATAWVQTAGPPIVRLTLKEVIGPMNALVQLQKLHAGEGSAWERVRLSFSSANETCQIAFDPEEPLPGTEATTP